MFEDRRTLALSTNHVTWSRAGAKGVLTLPLTKPAQRSGSPKSVTFYDPVVARCLSAAMQAAGAAPPLWRKSPAHFRVLRGVMFKRVGLDREVFKPYALRRDGATAHYLEHNHLQSTQHRGRWASYRACRLNVVEGQRELADASLSDRCRLLIIFYADVPRRYVAHFG